MSAEKFAKKFKLPIPIYTGLITVQTPLNKTRLFVF